MIPLSIGGTGVVFTGRAGRLLMAGIDSDYRGGHWHCRFNGYLAYDFLPERSQAEISLGQEGDVGNIFGFDGS